ncbi:MAG: VCBS repeat-containing protein [Reichenbachiella sp.]|uniref:VCBS repeat-containing protein n=1 Tax=Reichenbachiella sp. TaxID=2184521 RepID=UPI0032997C5B
MRRIIYLILMLGLFACEQETILEETVLFKEVSTLTSGVNFRNDIPESESMNSFVYEYYYNGGGVATGDLNGDGLEDIFFTSNLGPNALYLNTGDLEFIDVTKKVQIEGKEGWTTGVSMVDINADEKLDIYVCYSGPFKEEALRTNELYVNQGNDQSGNPIFKELAAEYGLASSAFSTQAAYLDYDLDGDLDVYLLNHNPSRIPEDQLAKGRIKPNQIGDQFFENVNGLFIEKTIESGIYSNAISYGLGIGVGDLNDDGYPDIYISNDYEEMDYIYLNQKNKTFKEVVQTATRHISNFSMGNDVADYDNNGALDVLVLDMVSEDNYGIKTSMPSMNPELFDRRLSQGFHYQYMYNTLQRNTTFKDNNDTPMFTDAGRLAGITNTGWSWAPLMADFDNDGWKDIFITNGIKRDFRNNDFNLYLKKLIATDPAYLDNPAQMVEVINKIPKKPLKNYFYQNKGDLTFEKVTDSWCSELPTSLSNGAAYADLDNDGDLELIINNMDEKASIYQNNSTNNFVKLKFKGYDQNPEGIGAKVWVYQAQNSQYFEHYRVRGFQSSVSSGISVGVGIADKIDSIKIEWPNGFFNLLKNIKSNQTVILDAKDAIKKADEVQPQSKIFTAEQIEIIQHIENEFNDYSKQVLLPHKLSQLGPAVAIGDVNGDGLVDLFMGQAYGMRSSLYLQTSTGEFTQSQQFDDKGSEAISAIFFDFDNDEDLDLYVVNGGNEFDENDKRYSDRFYLNTKGEFIDASDLLPDVYESGSVVKVHDFDQDGLIDVFVGTRHKPGDYPSPASSYLLKNMGNRFVDVTDELAIGLIDLGLVSDMEWADVDQDGDKDMVIVGEWMVPSIFTLDDGEFSRLSSPTLDSLRGWYNSVKLVDIDKDGDLDYLLGNLGDNYKYQASSSEPFEVYYTDFDHNGSKDVVLGYYNFGELYPVRGRQCSSEQVPELKEEFANYHSFGSSSLSEIYQLSSELDLLSYKATNFSSGILLTTALGFEFIPFPNLAQLSSINDFLIEDWNNDGLLDLLVVGNLYQSEIETPRNDASYGLVLSGDGFGSFSVVDAEVSGFFVDGEARKLYKVIINDQQFVVSAINGKPLLFHKVKSSNPSSI